MQQPFASINARLDTIYGTCVLSYEPLDVDAIIKSVGREAAGATAVFIGSTRSPSQGKIVTHLEYQAYSKLCIKTLAQIVESVCTAEENIPSHEPAVMRSAVYHRLGTVPAGVASIVIAVSSPHRKEAITACEQILEQVKLKAQIWKRECYEGESEESAVWLANK